MDIFINQFYELAVLPQFGICNRKIVWVKQDRLGGDEFANYFTVEGDSYILIYEDYADLGRDKNYIEQHVLSSTKQQFEYVAPVSASGYAPSYDGFKLAAPSRYIEHITGMFTLISLE